MHIIAMKFPCTHRREVRGTSLHRILCLVSSMSETTTPQRAHVFLADVENTFQRVFTAAKRTQSLRWDRFRSAHHSARLRIDTLNTSRRH